MSKNKITYHVNGEVCETVEEKLTIRRIMEEVGGRAGINVNDLDNYYLTDLEKNVKYDILDEEITLCENIKFLATYKGKTPVA